jgi:hypothetical protein
MQCDCGGMTFLAVLAGECPFLAVSCRITALQHKPRVRLAPRGRKRPEADIRAVVGELGSPRVCHSELRALPHA